MTTGSGSEQAIPIVEETVKVGTRQVERDRVVLDKTIRHHDETVELTLRAQQLHVERVPIGREVDAAPPVRQDGETLILPVLEERLVVQKRLVLIEEVHVRRSTVEHTAHQQVRLRREHVDITRQPVDPTTAKESSVMASIPTTPDPALDPTLDSNGGSTHQIVAMFGTFERADSARARLSDEGIPESDMDIVDYDRGDLGAAAERREDGAWASIKRFFFPANEAGGYAEGLRRGQVMLVVRPPMATRERVIDILESFDPIDFDESTAEWRSSGWQDRPVQPGVTAGRAAPTPTPGRDGEDETIPVVEEQVRVGKRLVDRGGVRVRSYVVERPIEEDVSLREERVDIDRRPVDRPAGALPDDAFRERTIEVSASGEEPVVQKEARVVEEVSVHKDARERTETVHDTERKTEVEIEKLRDRTK